MTSIGLRPALLFFSFTRVHTAASLSAPHVFKRPPASNHFQRIPLRSNPPKPPLRIEESKLPHRPHTRESCCHKSDSHKFAEVAILRGALNKEIFEVRLT